jgi:CBS domain-containing protein
MTTVQQLLDQKGPEVWTVDPDSSVLDAIKLMDDKDVGSIVVARNSEPIGIFTERHDTRNVFLKGRSSPTTPVGEVMARRVVCARPDQTIEECMAIMTEKRVRHLPVLQEKKLIGLVSIGDLVKSKIADQKFTIDQLVDYIHG